MVNKINKKTQITNNKISYLCDSCGKTFTGKKYKIYDENFNECCGLIECKKCFTSKIIR